MPSPIRPAHPSGKTRPWTPGQRHLLSWESTWGRTREPAAQLLAGEASGAKAHVFWAFDVRAAFGFAQAREALTRHGEVVQQLLDLLEQLGGRLQIGHGHDHQGLGGAFLDAAVDVVDVDLVFR